MFSHKRYLRDSCQEGQPLTYYLQKESPRPLGRTFPLTKHGCRKRQGAMREKTDPCLTRLAKWSVEFWWGRCGSQMYGTVIVLTPRTIIIILGEDRSVRLFPFGCCLDRESWVSWSKQVRNGKLSKLKILRALTAVDLVWLIHAVVVAITHPLQSDAAPISTAMCLCGIAIWRKGKGHEDGENQHDKHLELSGSWFQLKRVCSNCSNTFNNFSMMGMAQFTSQSSLWPTSHHHDLFFRWKTTVQLSQDSWCVLLLVFFFFLLFSFFIKNVWFFTMAQINRILTWVSQGR